jgi:hypothetical protein
MLRSVRTPWAPPLCPAQQLLCSHCSPIKARGPAKNADVGHWKCICLLEGPKSNVLGSPISYPRDRAKPANHFLARAGHFKEAWVRRNRFRQELDCFFARTRHAQAAQVRGRYTMSRRKNVGQIFI